MLHKTGDLLRLKLLSPVAVIRLVGMNQFVVLSERSNFVFLCNYIVWASVGVDLFWFVAVLRAP